MRWYNTLELTKLENPWKLEKKDINRYNETTYCAQV